MKDRSLSTMLMLQNFLNINVLHTLTCVSGSNDRNRCNNGYRGKPCLPRKIPSSPLGITKAEREEYKELLKILGLGLEDRLTSKVGLLSGGQRQALTLLMATLQKPKLLLDEHTAALDPKTAAKVLEITDMIVNRDHLTTLMITHNMKDAIAHGNRLIMMMEGKIILDIQGEEKKKLTVKNLLDQFEKASGEEFSNDSALLG